MKLYTLNMLGVSAIRAFIEEHGRPNLRPTPFYAQAEKLASSDKTASIEIHADLSDDGLPHALNLEPEWFDSKPKGE